MSLQNCSGFIWVNGEFVPWQEARVHVLTHTLHYGVGVFEGVRAYDTKWGSAIFRLQDHTDRLFHSAHILDMDMPYSRNELNQVQHDLLIKNNLTSAYLRPLVFYGGESLGLQTAGLSVQVMVAAWEWSSYHGKNVDVHQGIKVKTSSFTRHHVNSVMCRAKSNGNYINSVLALKEAKSCGCDEALLLDHEGFVAEGSGENIFLVRGGKLFTPDSTAILEGITRDSIFTIAKNNNLVIKEKRITRDELYIADEAFFTGTASEIVPISSVDGRKIGSGQKGPITHFLQEKYSEVVRGKDLSYHHWLSFNKRNQLASADFKISEAIETD